MTTEMDSFPSHLDDFVFLVVDDNESVRRLMEGLLKALGFSRVMLAEGGDAALRLVEASPIRPHIILCDWAMPNMDGLQFHQEIREKASHAKFIMVTATDTIEAAMFAKAHGVDGYLTKPVTRTKLENVIINVLGRPLPDLSRTGK